MSLVKGNSENLALKDYSSFDSPRYDCILFVPLIMLNGESITAKNVLFITLVKVNSENMPLNDNSSFESPMYDCVLFMSLIKLKGKCFSAYNAYFLSLVKLNSKNFALKDFYLLTCQDMIAYFLCH